MRKLKANSIKIFGSYEELLAYSNSPECIKEYKASQRRKKLEKIKNKGS